VKKLIVLLVFSVSALTPNFVSKVTAQQVSENNEKFPVATRFENQEPRDLSTAGSVTPETSLNFSNYQKIYFNQHNDSFTARRTLSFTNKYHHNDSLTEIISAVTAVKKNKLTLSPAGMMMDSGLSYSLPVSQSFSAFASLQPSLTYTVTAPQTMWAAGFQIPLANRTSGGQDLALKFATTMDQRYRPVFFFSLNLMSLGRK
jgi:hypothetical protein